MLSGKETNGRKKLWEEIEVWFRHFSEAPLLRGNDMLEFAWKHGWIPTRAVLVLTAFSLEILLLLALAAFAGNDESRWDTLSAAFDFVALLIAVTMAYFLRVAWCYSRLIFWATMPIAFIVVLFVGALVQA